MALENFLFNFWDKRELRSWNKTVKKICEKYHIDSQFSEMYARTQREIFEKVHDRSLEGTKIDPSQIMYPRLVLSRVYSLNKEFPAVVNLEFLHSANALAREIVEIYINVLYARSQPTHKKHLTESVGKGKSKIFELMTNLKKSDLQIDYFHGLTKDEFLETVYADFRIFSEFFHPSPISFSSNVWVLNEDGTTSIYAENPEKSKGKRTMILTNMSYFPTEYVQRIINRFYVYSALTINEVFGSHFHAGTLP